MNRDFLSNFEKKPKQELKPLQEIETYPMVIDANEFKDGEYIRNVCFVWPDGKRVFMDYSRLHPGEINADHDTIRLTFNEIVVELKGVALLPLFLLFMNHQKKFVYCDDTRYNELSNGIPLVNEISIIPNS